MTIPKPPERRHEAVTPRGPFSGLFTTLPLNSRELSAMEGVRAALVVAVPVAAAQLLGLPGLMWAAVAAFWTSLTDSDGPIFSRLAVFFTFTSLGAITTVLATASHPHGLAWVLPLTFLWTLVGAFASVYGSVWALAGTLLTCVFLAASERPPAAYGGALGMGELFLVGGVWSTVISLVLWRIQPYLPMRNAVWAAYRSFAEFTQELVRLSAEPRYESAEWEEHDRSSRRRFRAAIETARVAVEPVPRLLGPASREGDRLLLLVETADLLLGRVAALSDILERLLEPDDAALPGALQQALRRLNVAAAAFASSFTATGALRERRLRQTQRFVDALTEAIPAKSARTDSTVEDAYLALESLIDRLRTGLALARERDVPAMQTLPLPARQRIGLRGRIRTQLIAPLHDNLSPQSPIFRHAFRRAVTVTAATALVLSQHLPFGYWLTMSTVLVMQPFVASTWLRSIERGSGSAFGGALGAIAGFFLPEPIERLVLIVPLAVATMTFRAINYGIYISCLTPLFVLVADLGHPGAATALQFAGWRVFHSVAGSGIGLLGGLLLWPNWEAGRLPEQIASEVEAVCAYVRCVHECASTAESPGNVAAVDAARRAAGLASSAAENSLQQLLLEPRRTTSVNKEAALSILAALRRLTGTATTLYLLGSHDDGTRPQNAEFTHWIEQTSHALAAAARERRAPAPWQPWTSPDPNALSARIVRQFELVHGALGQLYTNASR